MSKLFQALGFAALVALCAPLAAFRATTAFFALVAPAFNAFPLVTLPDVRRLLGGLRVVGMSRAYYFGLVGDGVAVGRAGGGGAVVPLWSGFGDVAGGGVVTIFTGAGGVAP